MKAFVVGGFIPRGGTYMLYNIGRVLHEQFGLEVVVVEMPGAPERVNSFAYPYEFATCGLSELSRMARPDDLLLVNPSFSSLRLGTKLECRKLMYVQGTTTYDVIDGFCDHYVSVSQPVQQFLELVYGISSSVIPAFIETRRFDDVPPWEDRHVDRVLVHGKTFSDVLIPRLRNDVSSRHPELNLQLDTPADLAPPAQGRRRTVARRFTVGRRSRAASAAFEPQASFQNKLGRYRYFISLSPVEGFGLVPLEAMASGCVVVGFDGFGGREYLRPGSNSIVVPYPRTELIADRLAEVVSDPTEATRLSRLGRDDALTYSREAFDDRWTDYLQARVL